MQSAVSGILTAVCSRVSQYLARLCLGIGGVCLMFMVVISIANIVTRYGFKLSGGALSWTVTGANELVAYALLLALLAAMAAEVERAQVVVDVFTHQFSGKIKCRIEALYLSGYGALGGFLPSGWLKRQKTPGLMARQCRCCRGRCGRYMAAPRDCAGC